MTTTVESLRLEIDTRDVTRATAELDRMSASSSALAAKLQGGESGVWKFNQSLSDAQKAAQAAQAAAAGAAQGVDNLGRAAESTGQRAKTSNRAFEQFNDGLFAHERAAKAAAEAAAALELAQRRANATTTAMTPGQIHFMESLRGMADAAGKTRIELLRMQAAELGLAEETKHLIDQIEKANKANQGFSLKSSDTRQSIMSALTNLAQGNIGEARQALGSLVSQAAEAGPRFLVMAGAIGVAVGVIGGLIYMAHAGYQELKQMNNAIEMTGHYADVSVRDINRMADALASTRLASLNESRELITALVASGQIGTEQLEKVARVAIQYAHATGEEVDKIAPKIVEMFTNPAKGAEEFNRSTHALNVTQLEHIRTLEALGQKAAAQDALQEQMKNHIPDQQKHLGELAKAVSAVATAWQEVTRWMKEALNGKMQTPVDAAKEALQSARDRRSELLARGFKWGDPEVKAADKAIEAQEKIVEGLTKTNAATSAQTKENEKNALSWEVVRSKSQAYAVEQLKNQRALAAGFKPDGRQEGESQSDYLARAAQQERAKLDALRVLDKQIRDTNNAIGADGRAVATQRIQDELALHEVQRKAQQESLTQMRDLGQMEQDDYDKAIARLNVQKLLEQKTAEQRILALGGLTDAQIRQHQDRIKQLEIEANLEATRPDMKKQVDDFKSVKASYESIYNVNTQVNTALDDQIKKQKEANAELGLSAQVAVRVREARDALDLKQKEADAEYLRKRLAEKGVEDDERTLLQLRLDGLDGEIARRRELNALVKDGQQKTLNMQMWVDAAKQAQAFGQALGEAFGHAGEALGSLASNLVAYTAQQQQAAADLKAMLALEPDQDKRAALIDKAAQKSAQAQIKNYADMAGAAKGFFNENSKGYKALEAAERAFRLFELGMALANSVKKIALTQADVAATVTGNTTKAASATASAGTEVAAETLKGQAKAATAVANQAAGGDPYTAWVRMAAMVAAMAALGFMVSGGGGGPSENDAVKVQEKQGTGSVLGDSKAKSDSINKALASLKDNSDLMLPLTAQMAASLRAIQSGIGALGNLAVRSGATDSSNMNLNTKGMNLQPYGQAAGAVLGGLGGYAVGSAMTMTTIGEFAAGTSMTALGMDLGSLGGPLGAIAGAVVGYLAGKLIGGTDQSVTDSGLLFGGRVGDIEQNGGVQQYANVHTSSHGLTRLFSGGPKDDLKTQAVSSEISNQFALVFTNLDKTLQSAATALGQDAGAVAQAIDNVVIDTTKISLKDLKGQELTDAIANVLGKAMDDVAKAALPGMEQFQKVGEGYAETVIRVATGVEQAKVALDHFGVAAINWNSVANKQGDVGAEIVRQSLLLVEAQNGMLTGVGKIVENLNGTADDLATVYQALLDLRRLMGDVKMNGMDLGQDIISGAGGAKALQSGLEAYLDKYFTPAEKSAAELADLRKEFDRLHVSMPTTKAEFRKLVETTGTATPEAAKLTGALLSLADAFSSAIDNADALTDRANMQSKAESALQAAYNKTTGELNNSISRLTSWQTALTNFGKGLLLGADSPLTPEQKYAEAKRQYEDTASKAKAGDETAQANFVSVAQAFLAASRTVNASDQQYQSDYASVIDMTNKLQISAVSQVDIAKQQLQAVKDSVKGIIDVNDSVKSVADAIRDLAVVMAQLAGSSPDAASSNTAAVSGLYQELLNRAPDAQGLNYWVAKMAGGMTLDQVKQAMLASTEYTSTHFTTDGSHATGLEAVPYDGYTATLHKGEAVVDAQAMSAMRRYFNVGPSSSGGRENTAALVAELRANRAEMAKLREENAEQAAMLAKVMALVMEKNGDKVAAAVSKGNQGTAWAAEQSKRGVLK